MFVYNLFKLVVLVDIVKKMSGGGDQDDGYIVKLRGLPWSATTDDILKFFRNCKIAGGIFGIHMTTSREGRPSGEAFVEFEDAEDLEIALHKDREHIGSRYIEGISENVQFLRQVRKLPFF